MAPRSDPELLPASRLVQCACAETYARAILAMTSGLLQAAACLRCGGVSVVERLADEPRPHDVRLLGNRPLALSEASLAWLGAWPRVAGSPWQLPTRVYLPSGARAESVESLAALEAAATQEQADLAWVERLCRAGFPAAPPPELPPGLELFRGFCRGLALTGAEPLEQLLDELARGTPRDFVLPLLARRSDLGSELLAWLRDAAPGRRGVARRAVADLRVADPPVLAALEQQLRDTGTEPHEAHSVAATLDALGPMARALAPALLAVAERLGNTDYYVAKYLREVAARIG